MNFSILPVAEMEADDAAIWYDDQRPGLGDAFLVELRHAFNKIREAPQQWARLEYYTGRHEVRRILLATFPYLVIFVRRSQEIVVLAISHARRRPLYWLERIT